MTLKRCPFCDGQPHLSTYTFPERWSDRTYQGTMVSCQDCGAKGPQFHKEYLVDVTKYTVQDFRNDPILRGKEEEKYENYCKDVDKKATAGWNKRV